MASSNLFNRSEASDNLSPLFGKETSESRQDMKRSSGWFLALGIAMVVVGIFACIESVAATLISVAFIGSVLIVGAVIQAIQAFHSRRWNLFFLHLLASVLYFVVGLLTWRSPLAAAAGITLMLASFFMVSGLFRMFSVLAFPVLHGGWIALNGAINFILGLLVMMQWPSSALWVLGLFVGIDMIFAGWSLIMLSTIARKLLTPVT